MILTKCISSLQETCNRIPVESLSYDVTLHLISFLTSFSYNADKCFYFRRIQDLGCFVL